MMSFGCGTESLRRNSPRVPVESFCSELDGESLRHALVVDLSPDGLRLQRRLGGERRRDLALEFEIPEIDEIVWARGEICFDQVWRVAPDGRGGLSGLLRTSGIRIVAAAERHRRLLREYVFETRRRVVAPFDLAGAACYLRG